jgi:isopentenyl diphosphate isomerase/L-lactate dehydrogenase-like FMN-dependent dehydrogenase
MSGQLDLAASCSAQKLSMPVALGPIGLAGMNAQGAAKFKRRARPKRPGAVLLVDGVGMLLGEKVVARDQPTRSGSSST